MNVFRIVSICYVDVNTGFDVSIMHIPINATLEQFLSIVDAQAPSPIPSLQVFHLRYRLPSEQLSSNLFDDSIYEKNLRVVDQNN